MKNQAAWTMLAWCALAAGVPAQNTGARSTPQTQGAAPAGIGADATNAQAAARDSASRGSSRRGRSGSKAAQRGSQSSGSPVQGQAGITGVPTYRPGGSGNASGPAPAATGRVTVIGDEDGDGVLDRTGNSLEAGAPLPGITLQHNVLGIAAGTPIQVRLLQQVDSGHVRNGQMVQGSLAAPLGKVPSGAPVQLAVVAVAKAGEISSCGELSLQVVSVNGEPALSQIITAEGKEGAKILPDDAPARGTEAIFTPDETISLPAA